MENQKHKYLSVNTKISISVSIVITIIAICIALYSYYAYKDECIDLKARTALAVAEAIAATVDGGKFKEIADTNERNEYYNELQDMADRARPRSEMTYLYAMARTVDGKSFKYIFAGSANGLDGRDDFGRLDSYEEYETAPETYETGVSTYTEIYYGGEHYGYLISAFAPIQDEKGNQVGIVGADISADDVMKELEDYKKGIIFTIVLILIALAPLSWWFNNRLIGKRIKALVNASKKISDGGQVFSFEFNDKRTFDDEFSTLSEALETMVDKLNENIENEKTMKRKLTAYNDIISIIDNSYHSNQDVMDRITAEIGNHFNFGKVGIFEINKTDYKVTSMYMNKEAIKDNLSFDIICKISTMIPDEGVFVLNADFLEKARKKHNVAVWVNPTWLVNISKGDNKTVFMAMTDLYSLKEVSEDEATLFTNLGKTIANLMKKMELEEELRSFMASLEYTVQERTKELTEMTKKAEEASKMKSTFLANMSHEIRTPMNAIIGMSELLLSETLSSKQKSYTNQIKSAGTNLLSIINDILDFSKIEAGKFHLVHVHYNFATLIANINSIFKFSAKAKDIEFKFEIVGAIPDCLYGDDARLRQVLINIIGNAVKFTTRGYVKLLIKANEDTIIFDISDTGIGIKPEAMEKLFDAFEQVDDKHNRSEAGTGLGLTISKSFIEAMDGRITVESQFGVGSKFTVQIPIIKGNPDKVRKSSENYDIITAPDAKILVVDDFDVNLHVISGLLELSDIMCDTATNGMQAIEMIQNKAYDIVFMDHMMPEMDGAETTQKIRQMAGYERENQIIIALTANAMQGVKEMLIDSGMNDFLSKPIDRILLNEMLINWLPSDKVSVKEKNHDTENTQANKEDMDKMSELRALGNIDVDAGLQLVGGAQKIYVDTLKIFTKRISEVANTMKEALATKDSNRFAIQAHGCKSSLATLGAADISAQAYDLEIHAKTEDLEFCQNEFPPFLVELLRLEENLKKIFFSQEQNNVKADGDLAELSYEMHQMQAALNAFDDDVALAILERLKTYDYGKNLNDLIFALYEQIEMFEYDSSKDTIHKITSNLEENKS